MALTRGMQGKKTDSSGSQIQKSKEDAAEIMRKKQAAGTHKELCNVLELKANG